MNSRQCQLFSTSDPYYIGIPQISNEPLPHATTVSFTRIIWYYLKMGSVKPTTKDIVSLGFFGFLPDMQ